MALIRPFQSIRYNERLLEYAQNLMTPPYDVISPNEQEFYYDQSPFNVIRLILGKQYPDDTEANNRYTRSRDFLKNWLRDGVLVQDDSVSIYGYSQVYRDPAGRTLKRDGFMALILLQEWGEGGVFPHERTYSGPKVDRLNLVRATGCQMSCIFSIYSDPAHDTIPILNAITTSPEVTRYTDVDNVEHILTRCVDESVHSSLIDAIRDKKVFIADGHHRYETMLTFRDELEKKGVTGDAHRYALMYFTPLEGEAVTILPCHRIVETPNPLNEETVIPTLSEFFSIQTFPRDDEASTARFIQALERRGKGGFGFYPGGDRYYLLTGESRQKTDHYFPPDMSREIRQLDVSVLHHVMIGGILGQSQPRITYTQDARDALGRAVRAKNAVFLVNPTGVEEVEAASLVGERLPQKSTYFYPKTGAGLVLYRIVT